MIIKTLSKLTKLFQHTKYAGCRLLATTRKDKHNNVSLCTTSSSSATREPLPLRDMPGPRGVADIPFISTFLMLKPFNPYSTYTLETLPNLFNVKHDEYGDIYRIRLGPSHWVMIANAADVEVVFRKEGPFPIRRLSKGLTEVYHERNELPPGIETESGSNWYKIRNPMNILFNRPAVTLQFMPGLNTVADDLVKMLERPGLTDEQKSEVFFMYALESVCGIIYHQRLGALNPNHISFSPKKNIVDATLRIGLSVYHANLGLQSKYRWYHDSFYKNYCSDVKTIEEESSTSFESVKNALKDYDSFNNNNKNLVGLGDLRESFLGTLFTKSKLGTDEITSMLTAMTWVGTDSTARNLMVVLYNMAKNKNKQDKAAEEVIRLLGEHNPVTKDALAQMSYTKACVKESMRLNLPLETGATRELKEDILCSGYLLPKGTNVLMSFNRIARDPRYYKDPDCFIPERWLRKKRGSENDVSKRPIPEESDSQDINTTSSAFTYLPFSFGARSCPGRRFAENEMQVGLAKLLQKFHVTVDPSYHELDFKYAPFINLRKPIPFVFTKRSIT